MKLLAASWAILALAGCLGNVQDETDTALHKTQYLEATRVPAEDGARDVQVNDDSLTLEFDGEAPEYLAGDIVHGTEGPGYLRRVLSVQRDGSTLQLVTEQATLADAFRELNIDEHVQVLPS